MGVPDVRFQLLATGALVVVLWVIGAALARFHMSGPARCTAAHRKC
jgi:hypothetical protein